MKLSKFCSQKLDETEKRITQLIQQADGQVIETPFED
jgi:exonuclease VII small subunit